MLDFVPVTIHQQKNANCLLENWLKPRYSVSAYVPVHSSKAKRKQACMDLCPVMIIHYISIGFQQHCSSQ